MHIQSLMDQVSRIKEINNIQLMPMNLKLN